MGITSSPITPRAEQRLSLSPPPDSSLRWQNEHARGQRRRDGRAATATAVTLAALLLFSPSSPAAGNGLPNELCRSVPNMIDELRAQGVRIAYSEGLLRSDMLVRTALSSTDPAERLEQLVAPHGLATERVGDGTLMVVPGPEMDAAMVRERREQGQSLLQRETSVDALPDWRGRADYGTSWVEMNFGGGPTGAEHAWPAGLGSETRHVVITVDPGPTHAEDSFNLKQLIVDAGARASRARFGLQGERAVIESLVDESLAPYVDGYVFTDDAYIPRSDTTGRPWWRTELGPRSLLRTLLEGAERGAGLVLIDDAAPDPKELRFLEAIKDTRAGLLAQSLQDDRGPQSAPVVLLDPNSGSYFVALDLRGDGPRRVQVRLEPMASAEVVFPRSGEVAWDSYGPTTSLQLDATSNFWLIELEPLSARARSGRMLIENEVIVDPYEVVVANQIFQQRERNKVLSLDVMEYATIVPLWREGRQSRWEHRIIRRRGWLDEYHHLTLWRDGVKEPRDKLFKGILGRPIDRIEMAPLEVENRKTYRYRYLGQEDLDGHATWKIGFEPVVPGRLMSGTIWVDQQTGAHRRIKTRHHGLGIGILAGEYTTDFEWIPGDGSCHWDWRDRRGSETLDYLDFVGSYNIEYQRTNFKFNRPDIEEVVERSHASDILIHVAAPPDGHRWLLRGRDLVRRRGDQPYGPRAVLREGDECHREHPDAECSEGVVPVMQNGSTLGPQLEDEDQTWSAGDAVLAGLHAFPSRSRVSFGFSGGSGPTETQSLVGFNYVNFDLFGRGRRGKGELYLWIGGFEDDGLISLTDPELFGTAWSLTTSLDVRFDPEQDSLFRLAEQPQGGDDVFRDLSLDTQRTSIRMSASRSLTGSLSARFLYTYSNLEFDRRGSTDPEFVLPLNTAEHVLGTELTLTRGGFTSELSVNHGRRSDWEAWGLPGQEDAESSYTRAGLQISMARAIAGTQTLGLALGVHRGWNVDRFSRTRLFQIDGRVPGYSSSIGFDEGVLAAFSYNFNVWKLPFRLRFDAADIGYDDTAPDLVDQQLLGAQLNLNLHGPWQTDWTFGVGRGLYAEPEREEQTFYWVVASRRFGRQ